MSKNLNEKQRKFLDCLFDDDVRGNIRKAMNKAGYSPSTSTSHITSMLFEEIKEESDRYFSAYAAEAVFALGDVMADPAQLAAKEKMAAASQILDRVGLSRKDHVTIDAEVKGGPIFFLPEKDEVSDS